jgi:hypothetical protein
VIIDRTTLTLRPGVLYPNACVPVLALGRSEQGYGPARTSEHTRHMHIVNNNVYLAPYRFSAYVVLV